MTRKTGGKIWEFRTTAAPGEPGGDTWHGDAWKFGGGSVWNTPAVDVKNGLVVLSTGNPNPDYQGETRPGDNAYTDSILALHVKTGKLAWWYQEVPHDLWDYDASAPVMLFDAKDAQGRTVPAAGEAGKVGNVFIVNRLTGKLLHKSDPFVDQSANMLTPPSRGRHHAPAGRQRRLALAAAGVFAAHRLFLCAGRQYPDDLHHH